MRCDKVAIQVLCCCWSLAPGVENPTRDFLKQLLRLGSCHGHIVAVYHHSGVTVVLQWYSSGAVPSAATRQNLLKYKNNSAVKISPSTKNIA